MRRKRQKEKRFFHKKDFLILGTMVLTVIILFASINGFSIIANSPYFKKADLSSTTFQVGQNVQVINQPTESSDKSKIDAYNNWIGSVTSISAKPTLKKFIYTYQIRFNNGKTINNVSESSLQRAPYPAYSKKALVQIAANANSDNDGRSLADIRGKVGRIDDIQPNYSNNNGGYVYALSFEDGNKHTNITETSLEALNIVDLKEENSASQNNEALRQAFDYAKEHPGTKLALPSGQFDIGGSNNPEENYQILPSDTQLYGNNTQLKVQGRVYWLGLATGTEATDGVKNFSMSGIDFIAGDLVNGSQFMIMANHGDNWQIKNNTFTMVHRKGSHIFDLGGLQNSVFDQNEFIGYAPDLTSVTEITDDAKLHDYYAEAIQLDASDNSGIWDGGILQRLDSNYSQYNQKKCLSNNITISNNSFLPYYNDVGELIAYGASIGQHSSEVGETSVYGNTFTSSLVNRYWQSQTNWMFSPIHFPETSANNITSYDNIIN